MCLSKTVQNFYNLLVIVQIGELKPSFKIKPKCSMYMSFTATCRTDFSLTYTKHHVKCLSRVTKIAKKYSLEMKVPKATSSGMKWRRHLNFHL